MKLKIKKAVVGIVIIVMATSTVLLIRSFVLSRLKSALHQKLEAINKTEFKVHYDSLYVRWRDHVIVVDGLVIAKDAYDTLCVHPEFISARQVQIKGFHLLKLLFARKLNLEKVVIHQPHMVIREQSQLFGDSLKKKQNEFALAIDRLILDSLHIEYTDRGSCRLNNEYFSTLEAKDLSLSIHTDKPLELSLGALRLDNTRFRFPQEFYTVQILKTQFNASAQSLTIDTLKIIPHLTKLEFGKKKGYDIDRIEGVIPFVKLLGFRYRYQDTLSFAADRVNLQSFLRLFHDKRLPHKNVKKFLPVQILRQLPFGLSIDTLKVAKSFIAYEELGSGAETAGTIFFDNVTASILHITNDRHLLEGETLVDARADLMGQGDLHIQTSFPWRSDKNCLMKGSLKNFDFTKINPVLTPSTPLEIESGTLDDLGFTFSYNDNHAHGELQLTYHDLKVITFRETRDEKAGKRKRKRDDEGEDKDNFKTFLLNAFVIRKNMDEKLPEDKRTGTIDFPRDQTRSIFNFWWKSLLSGFKSAFHVDRVKHRQQNKNRDK